MGGAEQQFCLRWNNHQSTLVSVFEALLESETLVDVTLAAEGRFLKAHKVVLCACSPFFQELLSSHLEKYPIIVLKDVTFQELKALIDYMYRGEVNVSQEQLAALIKTAESLKIKGLADGGSDKHKSSNSNNNGSSKQQTSSPARSVSSPVPPPPPPPPAPPSISAEHHRSHNSPINNTVREGSASPITRKRRKRSRRRSGDSLPGSVESSLSEPPLAVVTPGESRLDHAAEKERVIRALGLVPPSALLEPKHEELDEGEDEEESVDLMMDEEHTSEGKDADVSGRPGPSHEGLQGSAAGFPPWHVTPERGGGSSTPGEDLSISVAGGDSGSGGLENRDYLDGEQSWLFNQRGNDGRNNNNLQHDMRASSSSSTSAFYSGIWIRGDSGPVYSCNRCGRNYKRKSSLSNHERWECGKEPQFRCPYCPQRSKQKMHIIRHVNRRHREQHQIEQLPLFISPDVMLREAYPPSYN